MEFKKLTIKESDETKEIFEVYAELMMKHRQLELAAEKFQEIMEEASLLKRKFYRRADKVFNIGAKTMMIKPEESTHNSIVLEEIAGEEDSLPF
jgi:hypothetical protein